MIDNNFRFSSNALYSLYSVETSANLRYTVWSRGTIHDNTKHEVIDHTKWSSHATMYLIYTSSVYKNYPVMQDAHDKWRQYPHRRPVQFHMRLACKKDTFFQIRKAVPGSKWNRTSIRTMLVHQACSQNKIYIVIAFDHSYCIRIKQILPICTLTYVNSD